VLGYHSPVSPKSKPFTLVEPRVCGIADALSIVGDRWALLVLRELGFGVHRFNEIQANTGAPRDSLATRLRQLEEAGLIVRRRYSEHPPRDEYLLTEAGRALGPSLNELRMWGETYARPVAHRAATRPAPPEDDDGAR
jgi:DNA-binding HxlR family transcriptional regulator